ncbi:DUF4232 domain-containing protein [Streptomyces sp. ITFR-6]|uniref:DUF4232 domain-containing protein n=1 Tax=Streptomyces sp. ITFR-6 TaxID=3075197 RepID=UPI00288B983A|nr:DUF4232 domain-containing protein [Streptomyces sp. ITFR-6]WNI27478.1 DUF4232 domain-containing protein [Streptomyces sp. ITFR-6]
MRTTRKIAVAIAATALLGATGGTTAQAAPVGTAPSACRPANHLAKITDASSSAGHRHYRVTLTAPRGYDPCRLAGSPTHVRFSNHGSESGITAGRYGSRRTAVTFGPGHPVHFDIQVPNNDCGVPADEASFTLRAPDGEIPGTSAADGRLRVAAGTLVGPVRSGA